MDLRWRWKNDQTRDQKRPIGKRRRTARPARKINYRWEKEEKNKKEIHARRRTRIRWTNSATRSRCLTSSELVYIGHPLLTFDSLFAQIAPKMQCFRVVFRSHPLWALFPYLKHLFYRFIHHFFRSLFSVWYQKVSDQRPFCHYSLFPFFFHFFYFDRYFWLIHIRSFFFFYGD